MKTAMRVETTQPPVRINHVEQRLGTTLRLQLPISPLGRELIDFYHTGVSVGSPRGRLRRLRRVPHFATIRAFSPHPPAPYRSIP